MFAVFAIFAIISSSVLSIQVSGIENIMSDPLALAGRSMKALVLNSLRLALIGTIWFPNRSMGFLNMDKPWWSAKGSTKKLWCFESSILFNSSESASMHHCFFGMLFGRHSSAMATLKAQNSIDTEVIYVKLTGVFLSGFLSQCEWKKVVALSEFSFFMPNQTKIRCWIETSDYQDQIDYQEFSFAAVIKLQSFSPDDLSIFSKCAELSVQWLLKVWRLSVSMVMKLSGTCVTRTPVRAVRVQAYVWIGSRTIRSTRFIAMIPAVFICKLTTLFHSNSSHSPLSLAPAPSRPAPRA